MAAALAGAQEVSLDGVLVDWDLPSCKAKLQGRYNTDNLAYGDKRAQLASTVLNAAGIQVTRRTDSRSSPTNMDDQDWDAMEIVDSTYKAAFAFHHASHVLNPRACAWRLKRLSACRSTGWRKANHP